MLHPGAVTRAILLRGIEVLEDLPEPDLTGIRALLLTGARNPCGRLAPTLESALRPAGADLGARVIEAGRQLAAEDLEAAQALDPKLIGGSAANARQRRR